MSNTTEIYGLTKPSVDDFYDVEVQNQNMDIIEEALKNKKHPMSMGGNRITNVAEPTDGSDVATRHFVEQHTIEGNTYVAVDYNKDGNITLKPYVADEDEVTFINHINNKNNPHNVTFKQLILTKEYSTQINNYSAANTGLNPTEYSLLSVRVSVENSSDPHMAIPFKTTISGGTQPRWFVYITNVKTGAKLPEGTNVTLDMCYGKI